MFVDATARVEGNGPTGCILLQEYKRVISELNAHQAESYCFPSLNRAIDVMVKWLNEYKDEAADCDAIVLATVLNPRFRVKFFDIHYHGEAYRAQQLIDKAYQDILDVSAVQDSTASPDDEHEDEEPDAFDVFAQSTSHSTKASSELEDYLSGSHPIGKNQTPLEWWKVCHLSM